jgi:hypothetical protein
MDCTECKIKQILNASDKTEEIEYLEIDVFNNERISKITISSFEVGYKYTQDYVWGEVSNDEDNFGGYSCTSITESVEAI